MVVLSDNWDKKFIMSVIFGKTHGKRLVEFPKTS